MKLALKLKLVAEGSDITMVAAGEVPVLDMYNIGIVGHLVVQTVNFLRSGCEAVQWLIGHDFNISELRTAIEPNIRKYLKKH